ncbi:MAG: response regulator transcription factor [Bacteroidota bacterium]
MHKTKILYVEDEPFLAKIVKESLESRDFEVNLISDGLHALPAFQQYAPDICVLDVMLPNRNGFEIGADIRQLAPQVPILYLTAKNQTEDVLAGFKAGGNDYIRKPFSMEELIVRIENLLQLHGNGSPATAANSDVLQLGQFEFHLKKYELRHEKHLQKLSHREVELLKILCAQPNQAVERKMILQQIWGDDSFFNSRNLDVYITKLRGYLKRDTSVKIITLKGVGYRLVT